VGDFDPHALRLTRALVFPGRLSHQLSDRLEVLIRGVRCPQVGRITMDMSLVDVTALRGRVALGDEVAVIGGQGRAEITADELATKLGTINYEIVTAISHRVPRVVVEDETAAASTVGSGPDTP
jgi:alanine racemase